MRDNFDKAIARYPDYPPGFRPADLEPRWRDSVAPVQFQRVQWFWLRLMEMQYYFICVIES